MGVSVSFPFCPADWMADHGVRAVSLEARGLWIDMLCLMHSSPRRGYLQQPSGSTTTAEQLARVTGCCTDRVTELLAELKASGVYSESEHGIFNRRMVRDQEAREGNSKRQRSCRASVARDVTPMSQRPNSSMFLSAENAKAYKPEKIVWSVAHGFAGIAPELRARWKKAYPACDLDRQLAAMDVWLRSNPKKASKSNWERFIGNWLTRAQDRGGDTASTDPNAEPVRKHTAAEIDAMLRGEIEL